MFQAQELTGVEDIVKVQKCQKHLMHNNDKDFLT